ncbi:MAG: hypothetical protein P4L33_18985 [Capsulimonadaceae bacterium]|nr:hypothetical protein [Capsulimonadaceae bacterium]
MKHLLAITAIAAVLIPSAAFATTKQSAKVAVSYHCAKCNMSFTAAQAKADHYKDPMDGGKLVPVAPSKSAKPASASCCPMGGMKM